MRTNIKQVAVWEEAIVTGEKRQQRQKKGLSAWMVDVRADAGQKMSMVRDTAV